VDQNSELYKTQMIDGSPLNPNFKQSLDSAQERVEERAYQQRKKFI
jgi:preprotein translocase subunit SecA